MRPRNGDLIVRATTLGTFDLIDAETDRVLLRDFATLQSAIEAARKHSTGDLWQQNFNARENALDPPFRVWTAHI
jgi:hypothetical protein